MRKTVSLENLVDWVSERNKTSTCEPAVREGWNALTESLLMQADAYDGYRYLTDKEVPAGHQPGIVRNGEILDFPDETRRSYFMKRSRRG